jgi:hypothetical protein
VHNFPPKATRLSDGFEILLAPYGDPEDGVCQEYDSLCTVRMNGQEHYRHRWIRNEE